MAATLAGVAVKKGWPLVCDALETKGLSEQTYADTAALLTRLVLAGVARTGRG